MKQPLKGLLTTGIILAIGGVITGFAFICIEKHKDDRTPVEWCYSEICTNYEGYWEEDFELPYTYKEVVCDYNLKQEWYTTRSIKYVVNYEITVYDVMNDKADVYFGGIGFNVGKKSRFGPNEIVSIDCDWIYSIPFGKMLLGDENYEG